jgi:putative ABC transport system permease protein
MRLNYLVTASAITWRNNKLRLTLTLLGIAMGIAFLTVGFSILEGTYRTINKTMAGFSGKYMKVYPGWDSTLRQATAENLDVEDASAIAGVSGINLISLQKSARWIPVKFLSEQLQTNVYGTDPNFAIIRNRTIVNGRFIDASDLLNERRVCVITEEVRKRFFPAGGYLENGLEINGVIFEIVGCLRPILLPAIFSRTNSRENAIFIPLTTYQNLFSQYDYDQILLSYTKSYDNKKNIKLLKGRIKSILKYRHDDTEIFTLKTLDDSVKRQKNLALTLLVVMCSVGAICLLIGGIGIADIMMVNLLKHIRDSGFSNNKIFIRFIFESFFLTTVSGSTGLFLGVIACRLITIFLGMPTSLTWWILLSTIGGMFLTGLAAGFFPAKKLYDSTT